MKIGELSTASSTPVETIRYYERQGLLPAPARTEGNFRRYEAGHLERLMFVRHCRSLDMSLEEVRVLLKFRDAPDDRCGEVNALLDEHIGHVSLRIQALRALEKQLVQLRQRCGEERRTPECGILNGLAEAAHEAAQEAVHEGPAEGVAAGFGGGHLRSVHTHGPGRNG